MEARNRMRRSSLALLLAGLLAFAALLVPMAMSHPAATPLAGEKDYAPKAYDQQLFWNFRGPREIPELSRQPCDNTDLVYGRTIPPGVKDPDYPGDEVPHEQQTWTSVDHMGHLYGARYVGVGPWDAPTTDWVWLREGSMTNWHLSDYEGPDYDISGPFYPSTDDDIMHSIMTGTDGFFDFDFGTNVTDKDGTEAILIDFHEHASYCIWAKPYWDPVAPWLFVGSAFVNQVFDWDNDTMDDFPGIKSASEIDLELYYEGVFRQQYPWYPKEDRVEAYYFLVESSLKKYPTARAWYQLDVTPLAQQIATATGPGQKDNGALGILHTDPADATLEVNRDYSYKSRNLQPIVQEHWVMLNETARRFGWPERELDNIASTTPDPLRAWEWYIDTDPRPFKAGGYATGGDGDTSDEYRSCPSTACTKDFPFPNPLRQKSLPQEFYVDDSSYIDTDGDGIADFAEPGEYTLCFVVYTQDAVTPKGVAPDWISGERANANPTNWNRQCMDLIVENIPPVTFIDEIPKWSKGDPQPRTRSFWSDGFDPDGIPPCIEEVRWDFEGEVSPFNRVRTQPSENIVLELPAADVDIWSDRMSPEHTFASTGIKKVSVELQECNGGVSEPAYMYVDIPPNLPPYIDPIPHRRVPFDTQTCFEVVGHDPEGYPLRRLTYERGPPGMVPEPPVTNVPFEVCWTPDATQIGTYPIHLIAEDDLGALGWYDLTIQVYNPEGDTDEDGIIDIHDNCPTVPNRGQEDADGDHAGDPCDIDRNGDGTIDSADADLDGLVDFVPECADGERSTACLQALARLAVPCLDTPTAMCTVNVRCVVDLQDPRCDPASRRLLEALAAPSPDAADKTCYLADPCPGDAENACAAAIPDASDIDFDLVPDIVDNCPRHANADQRDFDLDLQGDACDQDLDGDGIDQTSSVAGTFLDNCPHAPNHDQADLDRNGIGDACEGDLRVQAVDLAGRRPITADDCDDCGIDVAATQAQSQRTLVDRVGAFGIVAMAAGVLIIVAVTVGLTVWARRKWAE